MSQTKTVSVDQIAYDGMCQLVGQLQGQVQLLQAQLQFERQEKNRALSELEKLKSEKKPDKEGE